jgi:23S rRNA pseudouridine2605 synthase
MNKKKRGKGPKLPAAGNKRLNTNRIRLNKYMADAGVASRRKADEIIESGAVKVNGKTVTKLGTMVRLSDLVTVNGDPISQPEKDVYILLNKPKDYISTTDDELNRRTVMDIVRKKERLFPVGRLDRNTTGVLLITNDGELSHRLMHPSYQVIRSYSVRLDKPLEIDHAHMIAKGVELEGVKTAPAEILIDPKDKTHIYISLTEGKNREVRRLFEEFGYRVKQLDRKAYGTLTAKGLPRGQYRHLDRKEVLALRRLVGLK